MIAIVYTSETGHTKAYAEMLGNATGLPVLPLKDAQHRLSRRTPVIYMGWLMAGHVQGLKRAAELYNVRAVCAVGMGADQSQLTDVRKTNKIAATMPLFYLQGGFELQKLHGLHRFMMSFIRSSA